MLHVRQPMFDNLERIYHCIGQHSEHNIPLKAYSMNYNNELICSPFHLLKFKSIILCTSWQNIEFRIIINVCTKRRYCRFKVVSKHLDMSEKMRRRGLGGSPNSRSASTTLEFVKLHSICCNLSHMHVSNMTKKCCEMQFSNTLHLLDINLGMFI